MKRLAFVLTFLTILPGGIRFAAAPFTSPQARGAAPAPLEMLFRLTLQNNMRLPLTQDSVTTPNVDLQLYGDGKNIIVATGNGPQLPRLFFGLCKGPCGFTLRDRSRYFDLRGTANIKFTTIVSGFHRVRPLIKLADGTLLVGDQAEGSVADYHEYQISFSETRWLRLDPVRGVTLGATWVQADLSKVEEIGCFDVIPGSGAWTAEDLPVERQPPPPAGGWIAVSAFELWGRPAARN
jgi:hypothetical protein